MINVNNYVERLIGMFWQYKFVTEATDRLHDDDYGLPDYMDHASNLIGMQLKDITSVPGVVKTKYVKADLQKLSDYWKVKLPDYFEKVYTIFDQNFLLMSLGIFETFLKDVHRAILRKKPKLLDPNKKIDLGRVISSGYDEIIEEEIERTVQGLDRKSMEDRASYFANKLRLPWSDDSRHIKKVSELNDLRNRIVHENPDEEVSSETIYSALHLFIIILSTVYLRGRKKYKGVFQDIF